MAGQDESLPPGRSAGIGRSGTLARGTLTNTVQHNEQYWARVNTNAAASTSTAAKRGPQRFFGAAERFSDTSGTANSPGPGSHFQPSSLLWESGSVSKKGYGSGFVSKAKRLSSHIRYTGPGAGAYEQLALAEKLWHRAVTIPKATPDALLAAKSANLPGPGAHEPTETRSGQRLAWTACPASQRSAFRTPERSFSFAGGKGVPPVGAYNLALRWRTRERRLTNFKQAPGHSSPNPRVRPESPKQLSAVLSRKPGSTLEADPKAEYVMPGPGAYDTHELETITKKLAGVPGKTSSMFGKAVLEADRFGRPVHSRSDPVQLPGPGQHSSEYGNFGTSPRGTRAGFLDGSRRSGQPSMRILEHRPPGPAFYHAEVPVKKQSWLTGEKHTFVPA